MPRRVMRFLCTFLIFIFPASLVARESQVAMVLAGGKVMLNGAALPRSTSVFVGDRLETSNDSVITILAKGSTVQVGPNSRLQFQGDAITLTEGSAQVSTRRRMMVQADSLTVKPSQDTAKYQITRGTAGVMVASLGGSIAITGRSVNEVLGPGESRIIADDGEKKQKKDRDGAGAAATTDRQFFLWASAALAVGGFLAWWFTRDDRKPLSNQLP